jgi:flagellar biosynthesis anti-sigma factor FlgM
MKIDVTNPASPVSPELNQVAGNKSQITADVPKEDSVSVGSEGAIIASLTQKVMQTPETRGDRIAELREAISNGNYKLDPKAIADAIIRDGE